MLALTATASPPVREEIVERLRMREPQQIVRGFDRPNIRLGVERFEDERAKRDALLKRVAQAEKPGIVYAATRKGTGEIAEDLRERGVRAVHYHGGMKAEERRRIQEQFMGDEAEVIVATIAFGMGVDKENVRFVFHHDVPDSVDSYYQEIGRAGRDGERAEATLFYRPEDLGLRRFLAGGGRVDEERVERVVEAVRKKRERPIDPRELRAETELSQTKLTTALGRLEEVGAVVSLPTGEVVAGGRIEEGGVIEEATLAQKDREQFDRSRIEMIRGYAEVRDCRREYLLNYFGEEYDAPCGNCSNCESGVVLEDDLQNQPFPLHGRVVHEKWGEGTVQRYEDDKMVVLFERVGYKTLGVALVKDCGLLEAAN